jgi:hypothetical protein
MIKTAKEAMDFLTNIHGVRALGTAKQGPEGWTIESNDDGIYPSFVQQYINKQVDAGEVEATWNPDTEKYENPEEYEDEVFVPESVIMDAAYAAVRAQQEDYKAQTPERFADWDFASLGNMPFSISADGEMRIDDTEASRYLESLGLGVFYKSKTKADEEAERLNLDQPQVVKDYKIEEGEDQPLYTTGPETEFGAFATTGGWTVKPLTVDKFEGYASEEDRDRAYDMQKENYPNLHFEKYFDTKTGRHSFREIDDPDSGEWSTRDEQEAVREIARKNAQERIRADAEGRPPGTYVYEEKEDGSHGWNYTPGARSDMSVSTSLEEIQARFNAIPIDLQAEYEIFDDYTPQGIAYGIRRRPKDDPQTARQKMNEQMYAWLASGDPKLEAQAMRMDTLLDSIDAKRMTFQDAFTMFAPFAENADQLRKWMSAMNDIYQPARGAGLGGFGSRPGAGATGPFGGVGGGFMGDTATGQEYAFRQADGSFAAGGKFSPELVNALNMQLGQYTMGTGEKAAAGDWMKLAGHPGLYSLLTPQQRGEVPTDDRTVKVLKPAFSPEDEKLRLAGKPYVTARIDKDGNRVAGHRFIPTPEYFGLGTKEKDTYDAADAMFEAHKQGQAKKAHQHFMAKGATRTTYY